MCYFNWVVFRVWIRSDAFNPAGCFLREAGFKSRAKLITTELVIAKKIKMIKCCRLYMEIYQIWNSKRRATSRRVWFLSLFKALVIYRVHRNVRKLNIPSWVKAEWEIKRENLRWWSTSCSSSLVYHLSWNADVLSCIFSIYLFSSV